MLNLYETSWSSRCRKMGLWDGTLETLHQHFINIFAKLTVGSLTWPFRGTAMGIKRRQGGRLAGVWSDREFAFEGDHPFWKERENMRGLRCVLGLKSLPPLAARFPNGWTLGFSSVPESQMSRTKCDFSPGKLKNRIPHSKKSRVSLTLGCALISFQAFSISGVQ